MYHSFPRRRGEQNIAKGLKILELIVKHGLLLTPELTTWKDRKLEGPAEEYVQVARRCCFTELGRSELDRHAEYFGPFALELTHRSLMDLGGMPVFYIPKMSTHEDYGLGPAIVTQLAHIQELLSRLVSFREFAQAATNLNPNARIIVQTPADGSVVLKGEGTSVSLTIPKDVLDRARKVSPGFDVPRTPAGGMYFGLTVSALLGVMKIFTLGIHKTDVLSGTVKGITGLFYPTERTADSLLEYYQQREWRILGAMQNEGKPMTERISDVLREKLLELDNEFFSRKMELPWGKSLLVDNCEIYSRSRTGEPITKYVNRAIVPRSAIEKARDVLGDSVCIETSEEIS